MIYVIQVTFTKIIRRSTVYHVFQNWVQVKIISHTRRYLYSRKKIALRVAWFAVLRQQWLPGKNEFRRCAWRFGEVERAAVAQDWILLRANADHRVRISVERLNRCCRKFAFVKLLCLTTTGLKTFFSYIFCHQHETMSCDDRNRCLHSKPCIIQLSLGQ